jgi:hypothetical protein
MPLPDDLFSPKASASALPDDLFGAPAQPAAPKGWQDRLEPYVLPNGSQTVKRPDGAVYIKEANDPRFKGQEGWHAFDPKTGVWAPASDEDASAYGPVRSRLGGPALKSWTRNLLAGLQRPGEAVAGLGAQAANATGLLGDDVTQGFLKTLEDRERFRQAVKNTSGPGAGFTQFTGEMLPAAAATVLAPQSAPTVFASEAAMAPTIAPFAQRAAANAVTAGGTAYLTTPGGQAERSQAGLTAMAAAPAVQGVVEKGLVPLARKLLIPRVEVSRSKVPLDTAPAPAEPTLAFGEPAPAPTRSAATDLTIEPNLPGRLLIPKPKGPMNPKYQEVQDLFDEHGILARPGDISGNASIRRTEDRLLRQTPEMQDLVLRQNRQAMGAAERKAAELRRQMVAQDFSSLEQVQRVAQGDGPRAKAATNLLEAIEGSGEDWKKIMQTSGNVKLFEGKLAADAAYDAFEQKAAGFGEVPMTNAMRAAEELRREIARNPVLAKGEKEAISIVNDFYEALNQQASAAAEGQAAQAAGGETATAALPPASAMDTSFAGLRRMRSTLGNLVSGFYTGSGRQLIGKEGAPMLERLKGAIEKDMEEFATANGPELADAWRHADRIYKRQVAPYKDRALAAALADESPEKAARFFTSKGDPVTKAKIFKALDPKGQAAVRSGLLGEALDAATNPERGVEGVPFSPAKFASYLERAKDSVVVAFPGLDGVALKGLERVMRHVDRAGTVGANPMTGQVLEETLMGMQSIRQQALGKLEKKTLLKYYTTPAGKRALLQASELEPGSQEMQTLVGRMAAQMAGLAPAARGRSDARPDENQD